MKISLGTRRTGLRLVCGRRPPAEAQLAPYYPTPETIVEKMLQMGGLKAGEKMYDLGSGDGRIVIMAAQKFHADAVGVELDKDLCKQSMDRIRKLGPREDRPYRQRRSAATELQLGRPGHGLPAARFHQQQGAAAARQAVEKGARVVAHDFEFKNWTPEKVENIADDGEGRSHTLYLYRK